MSIREVVMYRMVCDATGCDASPQDGSEFYAYADTDGVMEDASNSDWIVRPGLHLCPKHGHRTVCMGNGEECPNRAIGEADDGWMYCIVHFDEGMDD